MDADKLVDARDALRRECRSLRRQNDVLEQDPERVRELLAAIDSRLHACAAATDFPSHPTTEQQEVLREIRSRAAVLALQCMAIMQRCACAVLLSALLRVHVAGLRPREAGRKDPAADAVVPAICRPYFRSMPLQLGLLLLWLVGKICGFLVVFDRFEPGSALEWLACAGVALTLPSITCASASLNARAV